MRPARQPSVGSLLIRFWKKNSTLLGMRKMFRQFVLAVLCVVGLQPAAAADFTDNSCEGGFCTISMHGTIKVGDHALFMQRLISLYTRQVLKQIPDSSSVVLELDSPGGDIKEALKLANSLAEESIITTVEPDAQCASACVVVLAGGVGRLVYGRVGIHRPFLLDSESPQKAKSTFEAIEARVKVLFKDSGVTPTLWDAMIAIPPSRVRYLSSEEVSNYGLSGTNPAFFDYADSMRAKKLGIDKVELFRRDSLVKQHCRSNASFRACRERVMALGHP